MMEGRSENDLATTGEELTKQVSLASNLLAEHRWRDAGEVRCPSCFLRQLVTACTSLPLYTPQHTPTLFTQD